MTTLDEIIARHERVERNILRATKSGGKIRRTRLHKDRAALIEMLRWRDIESAPINEWHQLWNEDVGGWIGYWPANYDPGDPLPTKWRPYLSPPSTLERG